MTLITSASAYALLGTIFVSAPAIANFAQARFQCKYNGGPSRLDYVTYRKATSFESFNLGESQGRVPHALEFKRQVNGYHRDQHGKLWTFDQNSNGSWFSITSLDKKHNFICEL